MSYFLFIPTIAPLVIGGIVAIAVVLFTRRRRAAAAALGGGIPSHWPSGRWDVRLTPLGSASGAEAVPGALLLRDGMLGFVGGSDEPVVWEADCALIQAARLDLREPGAPDVRLEGPFGEFDVTVLAESPDPPAGTAPARAARRGEAVGFLRLLQQSRATVFL